MILGIYIEEQKVRLNMIIYRKIVKYWREGRQHIKAINL